LAVVTRTVVMRFSLMVKIALRVGKGTGSQP
jgi:hypothetical protein